MYILKQSFMYIFRLSSISFFQFQSQKTLMWYLFNQYCIWQKNGARVAHHRCICSGQSVCQYFWFLSDSPLNYRRYALHITRSKHASAYAQSLNKSYHSFTRIWETITVDFLLSLESRISNRCLNFLTKEKGPDASGSF